LCSFGGAYLTYRAQTQTHTEDVKSEAYGRLMTETEAFQNQLEEVRLAVIARDQTAYAHEINALVDASHEVFLAASTVYILSDNHTVVLSTNKLTHELFAVDTPMNFEDFEVASVDDAITKSDKAERLFLQAARQDLAG
jgi:hypothetical protein